MKYSSSNAIFSSFLASSRTGSSTPNLSNTLSAAFFIMKALGSNFYTPCDQISSLNGSDLSLAFLIYLSTSLLSFIIVSSISITA